MIAVRNSAFSDKKDLHVGGLGAAATPGLATLTDPKAVDAGSALRPLLNKARAAAESTNLALRDNAWAAVGLVAALGLTVGYLLSRRAE